MAYIHPNDYGLIGNLSSAALVSRLGSIDWCCLPYLDSPSHFAAVLDENKGGRFQIIPQGDFRSEQRYLNRTHVLETLFETPHGRAVLTDWMPVGDMPLSAAVQTPVICRRLEVIHGKVSWLLTCSPRLHFGAHEPKAEHHQGGILFRNPGSADIFQIHSQIPLLISPNQSSATALFTLSAGQSAQFVWSWGRAGGLAEYPSLQPTLDYWRSWAHRCPASDCPFAGPWHDSIVRSALILKLMQPVYSGALSESISGPLHYCWLRNSAWAIQALNSLGYTKESDAHFNWLSDIVIRDSAEGLQGIYGLDGNKFISAGTFSPGQFSLDIYGHVMLATVQHYRQHKKLPPKLWNSLSEIADFVCQAWRRPDHGPWELRSKAEHYIASKVMCWVALDRACWLANAIGAFIPNRWYIEKDILHKTICQQGFDESRASFIQAFGETELDASVLLIPLVGFLPIDDPRVQTTLHSVQAALSDGVLLRRFETPQGEMTREKPHLLSSLLLISCLALAGRADEASDRMAELCSYATPLGLFGETVDLNSGETLGSFPNASVHLGLINAAIHVALARGRNVPVPHVLGKPEPRPRPQAKIA